jgi:hypothetical protein
MSLLMSESVILLVASLYAESIEAVKSLAALIRLLLRPTANLISSWHGPCTENTALLLLRAHLLGFPRDGYQGSPLARWLLPSNGRITDTKRTPLILLFVCLNVFTESLPSNGIFWPHGLMLWVNPSQYLSRKTCSMRDK